MRHGKAIGYCMAYQMYKECAEGSVNRLWKLDKPMNVTEFRERASLQMCQYQSSHKRYPGDAEIKTTTQKLKLRRGMEKQRLEKDENEKFILMQNYQEEMRVHCVLSLGTSKF